jgi:succinyl-CoA synthetase beta subunit
LKIHEYQAKGLFAQYGIPIPKGEVAKTPAEARQVAEKLAGEVVVKAQVHAGGRGKAGGIKTAHSPKEAEEIAQSLLGKKLITHQTGPEGVPVNAVLVEEASKAERELYLGIVIDSSQATPVIMGSEAGGMEIEEIAERSPEKIIRVHVDQTTGLRPFMAREVAFALNLKGNKSREAIATISGLYRLFREKDCSLAEINPLIETADGRLLALDAKLNFDDNALFRHPEIVELRDPAQEIPLEVMAKEMGVENYVKMDGNIGIVVNGAGLAMAVMDALKSADGEPANFLDIGTVNRYERVVNAFKILTTDPKVKAILVNIFGGMARVDVIATGIVEAFKQMEIKIPTVVRLAGTNVAKGEEILAEAKLNLIRADTFSQAIDKAVAAAKEA